MANLLLQGNQYIKSNQSAEADEASEGKSRLYGQNGYNGASSDLPGEHTCSGFLPECKLPADYKGADWQNRKVSADPFPKAHGMKTPSAPIKIAAKTHRR